MKSYDEMNMMELVEESGKLIKYNGELLEKQRENTNIIIENYNNAISLLEDVAEALEIIYLSKMVKIDIYENLIDKVKNFLGK